jgi:DME family drug/metabolite transporter
VTVGEARLSVLASTALFGTTGAAQALGPAGAAASHVGAVRVAAGGVLLLAFARWSGALTTGRSWSPWVVLAAGVAMAAFQVTFFAGVARAGVAIGSTVAIAATPVFTGALAAVVHRRRPSQGWCVATALAVPGAVLLSLDAGTTGVSADGVLLALVSAATFAASTLLTKRLVDEGHPPTAVVAVSFCVAGVLLLPTLAAGNLAVLGSESGVVMTAYLVLVPTVLGYVLFARGLVRLPGADAVTLTLAELLVAAFLGIVVLGERPGLVAVAGAGLLVAGLVVAIRSVPPS